MRIETIREDGKLLGFKTVQTIAGRVIEKPYAPWQMAEIQHVLRIRSGDARGGTMHAMWWGK